MNKITCLMLLLLLPMFFVSCEVEDAPIVVPEPPSTPIDDYRSGYCGDFIFESFYRTKSVGQYNDRPIVRYGGYISIVEGTDSTLMVRYRSGLPIFSCNTTGNSFGSYITPILHHDGRLSYEFIYWETSMFSGEFHGLDSIQMVVGIGDSSQYSAHVIRGWRL